MRSNRKHTTEELERYIRLYLDEGKSFQELRKDFGLLLSESTFGQNVLRYQEHGLPGIQRKIKNNYYSKPFKEAVVQEHLEEGTPIRQLARKYHVPQSSTVRDWIIRYTRGEEIRSYTPKPEVYTMKGKKTTQEEKIEIVKDFLATGLSYKETAEKHGVSYNNVYAWVQKYKDHGPAGLADGRGRGKPDAIQTAEVKLRTENAALKARNQYLEAENAALKKLEEMERELNVTQTRYEAEYQTINKLEKKGFKISHLCVALEVGRSSYYKWLNRKLSIAFHLSHPLVVHFRCRIHSSYHLNKTHNKHKLISIDSGNKNNDYIYRIKMELVPIAIEPFLIS